MKTVMRRSPALLALLVGMTALASLEQDIPPVPREDDDPEPEPTEPEPEAA